MKPVLVLGLALAANAMAADQGDNELIIAPTDQFGNIKPYPGHIRFDEQADDELLIRPLAPHVVADDELLVRPVRPTYLQVADDELLSIKKPREESKMTEEYKKFLFGTHYKPLSTQVADDELIIAPTDEFGRIKPYPRNIKFDEQADDELLVRPLSNHIADDELIIAPTDEFGRIKHYPPYIKFDEDGNEFFVAPTHRLGEVGHRILYDDELAARAGEVKVLLEREFEFKGRMDDEPDAELMMAPLDGTGKYNRRRFDDLTARKVYDDEADTELMMSPYRRRFDDLEGRKVYDDEADTELMRAPYDRRRRYDDIEGRKVFDDEADTELMMAPLDGTGKYNRRRFDDLTARKVYDDEADTELMMAPYRRRFDDLEGRKVYDDELFRAPAEKIGVKQFPGHIMYDEELFKRPTSHEDRHKPPTMGPKLFVNRQQPEVVANDDELMTRLFPYGAQNEHSHSSGVKPTLFVNRPPIVKNDDEGDDELAYLGDLLKHHKMDRFRDHELPEIRGRPKPANNGGFLPVN